MNFKTLYQKSKVVLAALSSAVTLLTFNGCESEEHRQLREEQQRAELVQLYETAEGLATYSVPQIVIETSRTSYTLDVFTHIGNALKADEITLPVSEDYFNRVQIGEELESQFNVAGMLLEGTLESYDVEVVDKRRQNMYCRIVNNSCQEVQAETYEELVKLNTERQEFRSSEQHPDLLLRDGSTSIADLFSDSCDVTLRSRRENFTLDIFRHITNWWNTLEYPVELPRFLCDDLNPGQELDQHFIGASLFLSRSPSWVTFEVTEIHRNY